MTFTRKEANAAGISPKNLHGDDRADSPPTGARGRSKSPKKTPTPALPSAMATATTAANSEVSGGHTGIILPEDLNNPNHINLPQPSVEDNPSMENNPSITSHSSISVHDSDATTTSNNLNNGILDASGLVGNVNASRSGPDLLAQRTVDMLTNDPEQSMVTGMLYPQTPNLQLP